MRRILPTATMAAAILAALVAGAARAGRSHAETSAAAPYARLYSLVGDFALGARTSRTDYESLDAAAGRLYVAKMGAGTLAVFDVAHNRLVTELDGFPRITGVLVVPELRRLYASVPGAGLVPAVSIALGIAGLSTGRGAVSVVDTASLREIARLPGGVFPDGIAYDPGERRIFVSDERGGAVLAIEADANRLAARIDAGGEVGNVRYDPVTAALYAPVQSRDELATFDPAGGRLTARHHLPGCRHPHGLMIAPGAPIGYVACDGNDRLLTVMLATGAVLGGLPVAHDPDVLDIDPGARRLYAASESGRLSAFDIAAAEAPRPLGTVFAGRGAHAVAVDPASHRLYLPLADLDGRAVLRVLTPKD